MSFVSVFILTMSLIIFVRNDVNVTDSGIISWKEGDFAIIFYVTLNNFGNRPVIVVVDMIKCCEQITDIDIDCNHFKLVGSSIDLEAHRIKNITLVYLNMYSYNRRGTCNVRINIIYNEIKHLESTVIRQIHFDTTLIQKKKFTWLTGNSILKCESPDEDPLDSCLPVNCHMKYSGYRGFFSTSINRCVQIPMCQQNYTSEQAYLWFTNQCVDANNTVTQDDIQEVLYRIKNNISDEMYQTIDTIPSSQKIRCHKGHLNNLTGLCDCIPGWESEKNLNWDDYIPSTVPLYMCTIHKKQIFENPIWSLINNIIPENWTKFELICSLLLSFILTLLMSWYISSMLIYSEQNDI